MFLIKIYADFMNELFMLLKLHRKEYFNFKKFNFQQVNNVKIINLLNINKSCDHVWMNCFYLKKKKKLCSFFFQEVTSLLIAFRSFDPIRDERFYKK